MIQALLLCTCITDHKKGQYLDHEKSTTHGTSSWFFKEQHSKLSSPFCFWFRNMQATMDTMFSFPCKEARVSIQYLLLLLLLNQFQGHDLIGHLTEIKILSTTCKWERDAALHYQFMLQLSCILSEFIFLFAPFNICCFETFILKMISIEHFND